MRVIGSNLVAFNDVTKKATATIDLKKAIAVEDDQEPWSPSSPRASRYADEYDGLHGLERSFRLIFPHDQEITFLADTDEEKNKWFSCSIYHLDNCADFFVKFLSRLGWKFCELSSDIFHLTLYGQNSFGNVKKKCQNGLQRFNSRCHPSHFNPHSGAADPHSRVKKVFFFIIHHVIYSLFSPFVVCRRFIHYLLVLVSA